MLERPDCVDADEADVVGAGRSKQAERVRNAGAPHLEGEDVVRRAFGGESCGRFTYS